nr:C40 family peptidase [Marinilactibacillus kalidii]
MASEKATAESDRESFLAQKEAAEKQVDQLVASRDEAAKAAQEAQEQRQREEEEAALAAADAEAAAAEEVQEESVEEVVTTSSSSSQATESTQNNESSENASSTTQASAPAQSSTASAPSAPASNNNSSNNTAAPAQTEQVAAPKKKETPKKVEAPAPKPSGTSWSSIQAIANSKLGSKYVWGSKGPNTFDCSGFTSWVFRQAGKSIPGDSRSQYAGATKVSNPQPGDLVFFGTNGSVSHVGIYAGGGQFVGAQTSTGVAYTSVNSSYWGPRLIGYGRY